MAKRRSTLLGLVLTTALVLAVAGAMSPAAAEAADVREGDSITIRSSETIRDDLYVFGSTVDVEGTVEGDVIAFASTVNIDGRVTGDVITGSSYVDVSGDVGGSVRAGSGNIAVTGRIAEDLVAGSGRVRLGSDGSVGRDVVAGAGDMRLDGDVGRNLLIGAGQVTIAGQVSGDADVSTGQLEFDSGGRIDGDLLYRSDRRQDIPDDAVGGDVTYRYTAVRRGEERSAATTALLWFLNWIRGLIAFALLALLVTLIFPLFSLTSAEELRARPLPSLGIGLAIFFGVPILAAIVFVVGILVGGWWLGLMLMALYFIALAVSVVLTAVFVGMWLFRVLSRPTARAVWAALIGLLVIWIVRLIPILGSLLLWVAMLFGLGAGMLALWETARRCRAIAPTTTEETML